MSALRIISNALTTLYCFRFFKSFSEVKNYSQVFGTPVSYLSRSLATCLALWTKE